MKNDRRIVRNEPRSFFVLLQCGCQVRCDHLPPSERLVTCEHGFEWVVTAVQPRVEYQSRRRT